MLKSHHHIRHNFLQKHSKNVYIIETTCQTFILFTKTSFTSQVWRPCFFLYIPQFPGSAMEWEHTSFPWRNVNKTIETIILNKFRKFLREHSETRTIVKWLKLLRVCVKGRLVASATAVVKFWDILTITFTCSVRLLLSVAWCFIA